MVTPCEILMVGRTPPHFLYIDAALSFFLAFQRPWMIHVSRIALRFYQKAARHIYALSFSDVFCF